MSFSFFIPRLTYSSFLSFGILFPFSFFLFAFFFFFFFALGPSPYSVPLDNTLTASNVWEKNGISIDSPRLMIQLPLSETGFCFLILRYLFPPPQPFSLSRLSLVYTLHLCFLSQSGGPLSSSRVSV
jgi:hypothetical protein